MDSPSLSSSSSSSWAKRWVLLVERLLIIRWRVIILEAHQALDDQLWRITVQLERLAAALQSRLHY